MRIELEDTLKESISNGINLFVGAGFSVDCENIDGLKLPIGNKLAEELTERFHTPKLELSRIVSIIESRNREDLNEYLRNRFNIGKFDKLYLTLDTLQLRSIYTTNIDNLIFKIFEHSINYYINDTTLQGPSFRDRKAIDYYPLHGCILNKERPLVFSSLAVASSFSSSPRLWNDLTRSIEQFPTVFWGYSLSDSGILETLNSIKTSGYERCNKWMVLHKDNPDQEEYFKALGFSIIVASNSELLEYFNALNPDKKNNSKKGKKSTKEILGEEFVPPNPSYIAVREINDFYLGASPSWSDIYRPDLYKTSHFATIQNSIYSPKDTIVIGIPGSGKTTLLMQLSAFTNFEGHKVILEYPSIERARNIINALKGEKALVFIDNFTEEVLSYLEFHNQENITLVGFDREHNFEIISHLLHRKEFDIIPVTTLSKADIQEIHSRIPPVIKSPSLVSKKNPTDEDPSLFEFVNLNLRVPSINERYKTLIASLDEEDSLLSEFLLLACYVHYCRTALSFDMAYSYFCDDISNYHDIYELRDKLGSLLVDNALTLIEDDTQDYFSSRSVILSEVIIKNVDGVLFKRFLNQFTDNLPPYKIVNYRTFRKKGHDKFIALRAFPNWEDGKAFYEKLMINDPNNPFVLQQGALYLSNKQRHTEAFYWIDKARNMSKDSILSIRNSHAVILFDANIKREGNDVKYTLDKSMAILVECYRLDKRKLYHAQKFAEQALEYYDRYADNTALGYLNQAQSWITEEMKTNSWHRGLRKTLIDVKNRLK